MPTDNDLHKAANKGDLQACKSLIDLTQYDEVPLTVHDAGAQNRRPLHRAAGGGHLELCKFFVEIGAMVDEVDSSGRTALHWASISGHGPVVQFLLEVGANILAESGSKNNCLHMAAESNRLDVIRVQLNFVAADADKLAALKQHKNADDKTPLEIAKEAKNTAVQQLLQTKVGGSGGSAACCVS